MLYNPAPAFIRLLISSLGLLFIAIYGFTSLDTPLAVNLLARHLPPDSLYWFGTDNLGRDLWTRCFQGALTSLQIGIGAALCSVLYKSGELSECSASCPQSAYPFFNCR